MKAIWNNTTGAMLSETNAAFGGDDDYFKFDKYKPLEDQNKQAKQEIEYHLPTFLLMPSLELEECVNILIKRQISRNRTRKIPLNPMKKRFLTIV